MISITPRATEKLKGTLINRCFKAGIGFRVMVKEYRDEKICVRLRVDKAREGDVPLNVDGIPLFVDPASRVCIANHSLDYIDEPGGGLVFAELFKTNENQIDGGSTVENCAGT